MHICAAQSSLNTMNIHDFESVKVKKHRGFCKFHKQKSKFGTRREKWELVGVGVGGLVHFHVGRSENFERGVGTPITFNIQ